MKKKDVPECKCDICGRLIGSSAYVQSNTKRHTVIIVHRSCYDRVYSRKKAV